MGGIFGKAGSFVVDHQYDNIPLESRQHGSIATLTGGTDLPEYEKEPMSLIETPAEKKARKRSHLVAYATMFVMSIGFSIVLTGVYPYMQLIDSSLEKTALGWVVAANPLGQMIASPLLGFWGYKVGSIRMACITTIICFIFGNALYSMLSLFDDLGEHSAYYFMIFFRFIVGVSSANVTLCRSYLAQSTTLKERTVGIAVIAASQALGFVVGPAIQAILAIAIPDDVDTGVDWFQWNKYTAAGWIAALLGLINLILMMPCIFKEFNIAEIELRMIKEKQKNHNTTSTKPNYYIVFGIAFASFISVFLFGFFEALLVPFTMDQYAWEDEKAVFIVALASSVSAVMGLIMYSLIKPLTKRFDERNLIIFLGFIPLVFSNLILITYDGAPLPLANCTQVNETLFQESITLNFIHLENEISDAYNHPLFYSKYKYMENNQEPLFAPFNSEELDLKFKCGPGCPVPKQHWCEDSLQLPVWQLFLGLGLIFFTMPITRAIPLALFTKVLGPNPQQLWMAFNQGVSTTSRILAPVIITSIYTSLGPNSMFIFTASCTTVGLISHIAMYKWAIPMKSQEEIENERH